MDSKSQIESQEEEQALSRRFGDISLDNDGNLGPEITYNVIGDSWGPIVNKHNRLRRFNLTKDGSSWVEIDSSNTDALLPCFETLWNMHPESKGMMRVFNIDRLMKRYMSVIDIENCLNGTTEESDFEFMNHSTEEFIMRHCFPSILMKANQWLSNMDGEMAGLSFNSMFINWYENGEDYIGLHSDKLIGLQMTSKRETAIFSMVLQEELDSPRALKSRIFRIKPKGRGRDRLDVDSHHGIMMIMGGRMQNTHKHTVPATKKLVGRRISITMRCVRADTPQSLYTS